MCAIHLMRQIMQFLHCIYNIKSVHRVREKLIANKICHALVVYTFAKAPNDEENTSVILP